LASNEAVEVFDFLSRSKLVSSNVFSGNDAFTVAIDPTGKYVAAGTKHLFVLVYDITAKKFVFSEASHRGFVSALAWSPEGGRLASAGHDGTIRVFSPLQARGIVKILSGHQGEINALAWTKLPALSGGAGPTTALFSGGADGTLRAWTSIAGTAFEIREGNWISAANWSPDGRRLAVVNFREHINLADPASGRSIPINPTHGNLFDVAWSPDGARLATASRGNGRVEVFDAATGRSLGIFSLPGAYRVAWSPSGRYLAACGPEGARVWDTKTTAPLVVVSRPAGCVVWHPDERRIVLGGDDGAIELWDAFSGRIAAVWRPPPAAPSSSIVSETDPPRRIFDLRWSPDGSALAFATQDSILGLLDRRDGHLVRTFPGHTSGIWRVAWNADGRRLASGGQDGMIRIFDTALGGQVAHISHGLGNTEVHALDWSRDGRSLVSGGFDRYVRVWDARRGQRLEEVEQLARVAQTRPDQPATLRDLARTYAQLGWVDDARRTFAFALHAAPKDDDLRIAAADAERSFASTLDSPSADGEPVFERNPRAISLLADIDQHWDAGKADAAIAAWRELIRLPGADQLRPFARTYFSRARWSATWFASKVDPLADPAAWRAQAAQPEAVTTDVRTLCFPYLRRGPKDLLLTPALIERGPTSGAFGMIARARIHLPAGRWRLSVAGGGGARVLAGEQTIIDNWKANASPSQSGEYQQTVAGLVDLSVEHFVTGAVDDFQFLIEPVSE